MCSAPRTVRQRHCSLGGRVHRSQCVICVGVVWCGFPLPTTCACTLSSDISSSARNDSGRSVYFAILLIVLYRVKCAPSTLECLSRHVHCPPLPIDPCDPCTACGDFRAMGQTACAGRNEPAPRAQCAIKDAHTLCRAGVGSRSQASSVER
jgi:hypothetical protein